MVQLTHFDSGLELEAAFLQLCLMVIFALGSLH